VADAGPDTSGGDTHSGADTQAADTGGEGDSGMAADTTTADTSGGSGDADAGGSASVYQGSGDVYKKGSLTVDTVEISADNSGSPVDAIVHTPATAGTYAVVVFQHGYSLENKYYDTILSRMASHGFVVVAPQMYDSGIFGGPTSKEEAKKAKTFYGWLETNLGSKLSVTPSFAHLGLAGHSRGGKVTWQALEMGYGGATSVASVDPVDGSGGPGGGGTMVTDGGLQASLPSLIIGTGLGPQSKFGMACAPDGRNHKQFYANAQSPSYHVVVTKYGHMDMLDKNNSCSVTCSACVEGPNDGKMRTTTAAMLTAFFRATLQGTSGDRGTLSDKSAAPTPIETGSK
jgi:chlorophyllase